jgi:hypothetical protein
MVGLMTPQELLQHLRSHGDATHTAISIYLEKLYTSSRGNVRQDPSVNSKKKPHSEEEEKEEEEQEEEEIATALNGNDVSHEHVDMNACDHSKQGLETQIASETHNDPESEVKDGCESSKNLPDDIDKDITELLMLSPYRLGIFDGIVKKNMPGKLFFLSSASSSVLYVCTLYPGASQYIAN